MNTLLWVIIGMVVLFAIVLLVYLIIKREDDENTSGVVDMFVGKLENTDSSIQNAMKYLELRNSIAHDFMEKK